MPKIRKNNSYSLYSFHILPLVLAVFAITAGGSYFVTNFLSARLKGENGSPQVQGKKTDKVSKSSTAGSKESKPALKGEEHKNVVQSVTRKVKQVASTEQNIGNAEVSEELDEVVEQEEQTVEETAEAIDEVENQPKWKVFLLGPDYKNLGQLRSALAHNQNAIRKLTNAATKVQDEQSAQTLQEQLKLLEQERERITAVIRENENQFSLLGWVMRLVFGYNSEDIDAGGDENGGVGSPLPGGSTETSETTEYVVPSSEPSEVEVLQ